MYFIDNRGLIYVMGDDSELVKIGQAFGDIGMVESKKMIALANECEDVKGAFMSVTSTSWEEYR